MYIQNLKFLLSTIQTFITMEIWMGAISCIMMYIVHGSLYTFPLLYVVHKVPEAGPSIAHDHDHRVVLDSPNRNESQLVSDILVRFL